MFNSCLGHFHQWVDSPITGRLNVVSDFFHRLSGSYVTFYVVSDFLQFYQQCGSYVLFNVVLHFLHFLQLSGSYVTINVVSHFFTFIPIEWFICYVLCVLRLFYNLHFSRIFVTFSLIERFIYVTLPFFLHLFQLSGSYVTSSKTAPMYSIKSRLP